MTEARLSEPAASAGDAHLDDVRFIGRAWYDKALHRGAPRSRCQRKLVLRQHGTVTWDCPRFG